MARKKNVGVMSPELAIAYGVSGPILRASGVNYDLRKDDPYSIYDRFDFDIPVQKNGDCFDRYIQRLQEIKESLKIITQALDGLPEGDFKAKVPGVFKPPVGETYARIENSRGELGVYLQSDGTTKPLRVKTRGGSYNALQVLPELGKGHLIADIVAIMASLDIIMPEVDR